LRFGLNVYINCQSVLSHFRLALYHLFKFKDLKKLFYMFKKLPEVENRYN
jgi:hypothetical protein